MLGALLQHPVRLCVFISASGRAALFGGSRERANERVCQHKCLPVFFSPLHSLQKKERETEKRTRQRAAARRGTRSDDWQERRGRGTRVTSQQRDKKDGRREARKRKRLRGRGDIGREGGRESSPVWPRLLISALRTAVWRLIKEKQVQVEADALLASHCMRQNSNKWLFVKAGTRALTLQTRPAQVEDAFYSSSARPGHI